MKWAYELEQRGDLHWALTSVRASETERVPALLPTVGAKHMKTADVHRERHFGRIALPYRGTIVVLTNTKFPLVYRRVGASP